MNPRNSSFNLEKYIRTNRFPISFKKRIFTILCSDMKLYRSFNELLKISQKISELFIKELFIVSAIYRFSLNKHGDIPYHFKLFDDWLKEFKDGGDLFEFYSLYVSNWGELIHKYGSITLAYYETIRKIEDEPTLYGSLYSNESELKDLINLDSLEDIACYLYDDLLRFVLPAENYPFVSVDLERTIQFRGKDIYCYLDLIIPGLVLLIAFSPRNNFTKFARYIYLLDKAIEDIYPFPKRYIVLNVYSSEIIFFNYLSSSVIE